MDGVAPLARRLVFSLPVLSMTVAAVYFMYEILSPMGMTVAEWFMLVLFSLSFVWIAIWFWNSMLGFVIQAFCRRPGVAASPILADVDNRAPIRSRTAIVMPIYNEEPARTCRRLQATYRSIELAGCLDRFEFFQIGRAHV